VLYVDPSMIDTLYQTGKLQWYQDYQSNLQNHMTLADWMQNRRLGAEGKDKGL